MVKKTTQNYIFEEIDIDGVVKYQEVFTGFIATNDETSYFDLPYVVDLKKLTDELPNYKESKIPKFGMLLILDDVNSKDNWKKHEKTNKKYG